MIKDSKAQISGDFCLKEAYMLWSGKEPEDWEIKCTAYFLEEISLFLLGCI